MGFDLLYPGWLLTLVLIGALAWVRWHRSGRGMSLRDGMGDVLRISVLTYHCRTCGPLLNSRSVGTDIVFLVDTSDSIAPSAIGRALDFVNRAKARGEGNVRTALVAFGADAAMERSLTLENKVSSRTVRSVPVQRTLDRA